MELLERTETVGLTPLAGEKIRELLVAKNVPNHGLRVYVAGGGCSGMQYGMALESEAQPFDSVIEQDGIKMFVDPTSLTYLGGATVDYEDSIMGGGFRIDNPNAVSSCGCGSSFKTEEHSHEGAGCASGSCGC